jgi:hypothetical protein
MEMKVSWLASKGKPAFKFAAASQRLAQDPPRGREAACVVRRRSFEYRVLRLPSVVKAEPEHG